MDEPAHSPAAVDAIAEQLVDAFLRYNADFRELTQRAAHCFEERDWQDGRKNAVARIELYDEAVGRALAELGTTVDESESGKAFWITVKERYAERIREYPDNAFFKTFFSSISRRLFNTVGVDPRLEFIAEDVILDEKPLDEKDVRTYFNRGALQYLIDQVLSDFSFGVPYRDRERTIRFVAAEIDAYCRENSTQQDLEVVELLTPIFYRATRAFIVGRIGGDDWVSPLVIAFRNSGDGIFADAVILSVNDVSMLFGFTRSYFHVDLEHVGATVGFLQRLVPRKPMDEIYTVLGRAKQGKTERYRLFFEHLRNSHDPFREGPRCQGHGHGGFYAAVLRRGIQSHPGQVRLPQDRQPRRRHGKVQARLQRDRAGRLVDAQEFRVVAISAPAIRSGAIIRPAGRVWFDLPRGG